MSPDALVDYGEFQTPTDVLAHNAYRVSWQTSDTATLSPQPPAITCAEGISVWVPGSAATSTPCPTYYNDTNISSAANSFITIGLPIVVVVLILACAGCIFHGYQKGKGEQGTRTARAARVREARAVRAAAREQDGASHGGPAAQGQS